MITCKSHLQLKELRSGLVIAPIHAGGTFRPGLAGWVARQVHYSVSVPELAEGAPKWVGPQRQ